MNMLAGQPAHRTFNRSIAVEKKRELRIQAISENGLVKEAMALRLSGLSKSQLSRLVGSGKVARTNVSDCHRRAIFFYNIRELMDAAGKRQPAGEILKGAGCKIDPGVFQQIIDPGFRERLGLYGEPEKLLDSVACCLLKTQPEVQQDFMSEALPGLLSSLHEVFNSEAPVALRIISQMKQKESFDPINVLRKKNRWERVLNEVKGWCACTRNNIAVQIANELEQYGFEEVQARKGVRALSRRCAESNGAGTSIVVFLAPPYSVEFHDSAGRRLANPKVRPEELQIAERARSCCSAFSPSLSDFASALDYRLMETKASREMAEANSYSHV